LLNDKARGSSNTQEVLVIEYPYEVLPVQIQRTVDLRLPDVRDWFFRQFSKEQEDGSIVWMLGKAVARQMPQEIRDELERDSVTIISRFQRRAGIAPPPADFFGMLPTLMNPELGGGTAADGGAILQAIGTWMCRNEVGALIYPSARYDTFVEFKSQVTLDFGGWNLVDYRGAVDAERFKHSYIVQSPWAWTTFPGDVHVEAMDATLAEAGSFGVVGMESYWRREYGYWIKSLDVVDEEASLVGKDVLLGSGQKVTRAAAWRLGSSSIEWLTLNAVDKKPQEGARQKLLFAGLAIRLQRPFAAGRIDEIETNILASGDVSSGVSCSMDLVDWIAETFKDSGMPNQAYILVISNRLHVLRFFVAGMLLARQAGMPIGAGSRQKISALLGDLNPESTNFSERTKQLIEKTVDFGLSLCDENDLPSGVSPSDAAIQWQQRWHKMCTAAWDELP